MKLSLLQENLNKALSLVSHSISGKASLPILANILISTDKSRLKLSATNLETGINLWLAAKIEEEGAVTIPAKVISEFIASIPPEKIEIKSDETSLSIHAGAFKANFLGTMAAEFPQIPTFSGEAALVFEKEEFLKGLTQVAFAAAQDEGRPVLTGVLLKKNGEKEVTLVATDGYRLSVKNLKTTVNKLETDLLIPAKTMLEVARLAQEKSEEKTFRMALNTEKSQAVFALADIEFSSRLLEGEFPDFAKIIPQTSTSQATFDKEEFLRAVRVASIFAREQANIVRLKIEEKKMKIMAETPQLGTNENEITTSLTGEPLETAFNCRFLLDFLGAVKGEEIIFEANGPLSPGVFKIAGDNSFLHIIMPVRLQS